MTGRLQGKVSLITGAANGMGETTARLFAEEGALVVVADIAEEAGRTVAAALPDGLFVPLDVTSVEAWAGAVAAIERRHGRLDVLINNAGFYSLGSLADVSDADFDHHVAVNQRGVLLGMRSAAVAMRSGGAGGTGGAIVNVSSTTGLRGGAGAIAYRATKWAVRGLTRSAAHDLAPRGIRVNAVLPGPIDTAMIVAAHSDAERREIAARTLLKRFGQPVEVARAILFLASDEASYITGAELVVDGGALA